MPRTKTDMNESKEDSIIGPGESLEMRESRGILLC